MDAKPSRRPGRTFLRLPILLSCLALLLLFVGQGRLEAATHVVSVQRASDDDPFGNRSLFPSKPDLRLPAGQRAVAPVITDMNEDGRADIVVALEADNAVAVLLGTETGSTNGMFAPAPGSPFPAGNLPFFLAVADLDGDDHLDVVAANQQDGALTFLKGDGKGALMTTGSPIRTGQQPRTIRIGDFNGDHLPDLLVANFGDGTLSLLLGDGLGGFQTSADSPIAAGVNPWGLATGDFDGNGTLDFAVSLEGENKILIFSNRDGRRLPTEAFSVGSRPFDVAAADLDLDGHLDLISADTASHQISIFRGLGNGVFTKAGSRGVGGSYPRQVVPVDLDRDGYLDLVTANEHFSVSLLPGLRDGSSLAGSPLSQPNIVNTVAAGDLNGDGIPDLIAAGPDFGLTVWLNHINLQRIEVDDTTVVENDGVAGITIRRSGRTNLPLVLQVSTKDESALAGRDYQPVRTEITFQPGEGTKVVEVPVLDDQVNGRTRSFFLELATPDRTVLVPGPARVTILDDGTMDAEYGLLRQDVVVAPYDREWTLGGWRQLLPLPSGKTLLWCGRSMQRLTGDGLPDPEFGRGAGRITPPIAREDLSSDVRLAELPNGSMYLVGRRTDYDESLVVLRFDPDGEPDIRFGDRNGMVTLTNVQTDLTRSIVLTPDSRLVMMILDTESGLTRVRRLSPEGQWDPTFQEWNDAEALVAAPDNSVYVRRKSGEVIRLLPDGRQDPNFKAPSGLAFNATISGAGRFWIREPKHAFDSQGRLYAAGANGGLIRILTDGSVDPAFRPQLTDGPYWWEMLPSGDVLTHLSEAIVRIGPDGGIRAEYPHNGLSLADWAVQPNGDVHLRFYKCGPSFIRPFWRCWTDHAVLFHPDGSTTRIPALSGSEEILPAPNALWLTYDQEKPVANPTRWWIPQHLSEAGLPSTGLFCQRQSASLTIQRTGSTANAATVRGRIWRRSEGRWIETSAQSWEARFLPDHSETSVDLSEWIPPSKWTPGDYLLRMEESEGVHLSGFNACRIWVLPDSATPPQAGLSIAKAPDADFDGEALVLLDQDLPGWGVQESPSPSGPWEETTAWLAGLMGRTQVFLTHPSTNNTRFFRHLKF
ncbi:MAG: VCBS repeat-containing protein [Verrucomicrobia bacterium]|nr:VCBS repeat-containing protein [Verrucomicrobiota bacterium]